MQIEKVTPAKQHLYEIELDDGQLVGIDKSVWEHSGFSCGEDISEDEWDLLCTRSAAYRAREKALYYLSLRDYGSGELLQKLCRAGVGKELACQTVSRLCESGLIDDTRYATMVARDLQERKLYSARRIAMALREKGFSSDVISEALSVLTDNEEEKALSLLKKKRVCCTDDPKQREKALRMLASHGYSYAVSSRALSRLNEE